MRRLFYKDKADSLKREIGQLGAAQGAALRTNRTFELKNMLRRAEQEK